MKIIALAIAALLLVSCGDPRTEDVTSKYVVPKELRECKVFELFDGQRYLYVVKCPHADTSTYYKAGKSPPVIATLTY